MPLVLVPTPIGNLGDITLRAVETLRSCDIVACEDTRRTLCLLNHLGISKRLVSCHRHNEASRVDELLVMMKEGRTVALVSDAGTPGISDPGCVLLAAARDAGVPVDVLPGANAVLPAVVLSGLDARRFLFAGFLEGKTQERRALLCELSGLQCTLVFYISPHRAGDELAMLADELGDRRAAIVREISKIHQEVIGGTLRELSEAAHDGIRGELVAVVEGAAAQADDDDGWIEVAVERLNTGESLRTVVNYVAERYGIPKNRIKQTLIKKEEE